MKQAHWDSLVTSLKSRECVLVLGPNIPALAPGPAAAEGIRSVRDAFCDELVRELEEEGQQVTESALFSVAQQYDDCPACTANLKNVAASFFRRLDFRPGRMHDALTRLPFDLVLTTCHDNLLEQAYASASKRVLRYWYNYRGEPRDNREIPVDHDHDEIILYHLFGAFDEPNSLVLTENDLLDFIISVVSAKPALPNTLRNSLRNKTFLFVGFGIRHWYIRVLLKLLLRSLEISAGSVALESFSGANDAERQQTVLFYKRGTRIEVVDMEAEDFLGQLADRLEAAGGVEVTAQRGIIVPRPHVFISYERGDVEFARALFERLPQDEMIITFDKDALEPGDRWDEELVEHIDCADYFLVLNTPNLAAKQKGYVNKEINLALERSKYLQPGAGVKFIVPLGIGGSTPEQGLPALKGFQQFNLDPNAMDQDVKALARDLVRNFQRRRR